ncbi:MAG: NAD(P)H-dependent oxidoreductase [Devosiaceae bacterium]|nr:NAD(P)H-dependent oxidoreductase [Devosiaceae bacterium MH13]
MKVVAFGASTSRASINRQLAKHAASALGQHVHARLEIDLLDLNDFEMPIFSVDRENEFGVPAQAHAFFRRLGNADRIIASFAEHNGSYTAAFKNILDWASRIDVDVYQNKPALFLSASAGDQGAASVLATAVDSAPYMGADLRGTLSVGPWDVHFDTGKATFTEPSMNKRLHDALARLVAPAQAGD